MMQAANALELMVFDFIAENGVTVDVNYGMSPSSFRRNRESSGVATGYPPARE
jgi:hypothetical protein